MGEKEKEFRAGKLTFDSNKNAVLFEQTFQYLTSYQTFVIQIAFTLFGNIHHVIIDLLHKIPLIY